MFFRILRDYRFWESFKNFSVTENAENPEKISFDHDGYDGERKAHSHS
jgi:hypothetical protein